MTIGQEEPTYFAKPIPQVDSEIPASFTFDLQPPVGVRLLPQAYDIDF
jgi:hypothetical protein